MSTPNDIEVMIHYYGSRSVHPRIDAPAVREAINRFVAAGLLVPFVDAADVYDATEGGKMYIEELCQVPLPKLKWVKGEKVDNPFPRGMTWFTPSNSDFNTIPS